MRKNGIGVETNNETTKRKKKKLVKIITNQTPFQPIVRLGKFDFFFPGGCMFDFVKITTVLYHKNINII